MACSWKINSASSIRFTERMLPKTFVERRSAVQVRGKAWVIWRSRRRGLWQDQLSPFRIVLSPAPDHPPHKSSKHHRDQDERAIRKR